ncbi:MAG: hypothetical protein AAFX55_18670 [Bacteroidota bacterium]
MKKNIFIVLIISLIFCSCSKDIDLCFQITGTLKRLSGQNRSEEVLSRLILNK